MSAKIKKIKQRIRIKILPILLLSMLSFPTYADDLKVADDFKEGDILSAETFNQIFDTIERINRKITDNDLFGTWSCSAMKMSLGGEASLPNGWINKDDLAYEISGVQVNFTQTVFGTVPGVNAITTSTPNPFFLDSPIDDEALNGNYLLKNNKIVIRSQAYISAGATNYQRGAYSVEFLSPSRILLTDEDESITCDVASGVPASPTGPTAVNAKTSIDLAWADTSDNETGFKIYRKPDGSREFTLLTTLTNSSYSDADTAEGIRYSYYVVSYNDKGESAKSKVVSATLDSILPTVIATNPADGTNSSGTTVSITFSEAIEIVCPSENIIPPGQCIGEPAIKLVGTGGSGNTYYMGQVGEKGIIITANPFVDGANPNYDVTISKDYIFDLNGNQMAEDYTFSFTDQ
tara:strand:+ start:60 stop:1277 length:1218 start_codon:yes stop_codon:yes gene_type:complete